MKQQYRDHIIKMVNQIDNVDILRKIYTYIRNLIKFS